MRWQSLITGVPYQEKAFNIFLFFKIYWPVYDAMEKVVELELKRLGQILNASWYNEIEGEKSTECESQTPSLKLQLWSPFTWLFPFPIVLFVVEPDLSSARYRCALPNIQIGNENLNKGYAIAQFLLNIPSIASWGQEPSYVGEKKRVKYQNKREWKEKLTGRCLDITSWTPFSMGSGWGYFAYMRDITAQHVCTTCVFSCSTQAPNSQDLKNKKVRFTLLPTIQDEQTL